MTSRIGRLALENSAHAGETNDCKYVAEPSACVKESTSSLFGLLRLKLKSDEDLMEQLQNGQADALTVLFNRHNALIFRIAHRVLRDAGEAEDAVQQVFLDLFRSNEQFDSKKGTFKTWLLMFAYHRTFNRRRHLSANRFYDSQAICETLPGLLEGASRPFPFSAVETAVLVQESLGHLHPRQRRTVELVYYEGLTAGEISVRTGESVRVVRHNLYRGLEKLRTLLCARETSRSTQTEAQTARTRL
jgi:RNA polymerase sigma-70 factor, ECF subfamily